MELFQNLCLASLLQHIACPHQPARPTGSFLSAGVSRAQETLPPPSGGRFKECRRRWRCVRRAQVQLHSQTLPPIFLLVVAGIIDHGVQSPPTSALERERFPRVTLARAVPANLRQEGRIRRCRRVVRLQSVIAILRRPPRFPTVQPLPHGLCPHFQACNRQSSWVPEQQ